MQLDPSNSPISPPYSPGTPLHNAVSSPITQPCSANHTPPCNRISPRECEPAKTPPSTVWPKRKGKEKEESEESEEGDESGESEESEEGDESEESEDSWPQQKRSKKEHGEEKHVSTSKKEVQDNKKDKDKKILTPQVKPGMEYYLLRKRYDREMNDSSTRNALTRGRVRRMKRDIMETPNWDLPQTMPEAETGANNYVVNLVPKPFQVKEYIKTTSTLLEFFK